MSPTLKDTAARLEAYLAEQAGAPVRVANLRQLTGGASRDTWSFDADIGGERLGLVLRRDLGGNITDEALSREHEFRLLETAHQAGILVPRPRWLCPAATVLGAPFFIMDRLEGESVGRRIVREPALAEARKKLPRQMGEQLARIHAIDPRGLDFLPQPEPNLSPAQSVVERAALQLWGFAEPHPVLELALRWLRRHAPPCSTPILLHGDFRVGNLMVGPEGLVGVFDWEFAHVGDPAEDLAWPCVRSWRFGQDNLHLGGVGDPAEFLDAYEKAGGRKSDPASLHFWEVMGNFRWALGCIAQADRHLSGQAVSVELASLGRRTAEMELELLELISNA